MSSRRGSSNNGGGVQSIPAASKKVVQSLKEIVNCPEPEIYAMLKECNMDPNEAVNRLLSQDPFHEVKSKREKKKENKETTESRSRGVNSTSSRGSRGAADRYLGRGSSSQSSAPESSAVYGKPSYKKENGAKAYKNFSSSASGVAGDNTNWQPPPFSDSTAENKGLTINPADSTSFCSQPLSGYQSVWLGVPGQVSMADIVKMGRPHGKASGTAKPSQHAAIQHHVQAPMSIASQQELLSSEGHASKVLEKNPGPGVGMGHHVSAADEWPSVEGPPADIVPSMHADTGLYKEPSNLFFDRINEHQSQVDEVREEEVGAVDNLSANHVGSAHASSRKMLEDNSGGGSLFHNDLHKNAGLVDPQKHALEQQEAEDGGGSVSSVTANFQHVTVLDDDRGAPSEEENPSVIIPHHLQVQTVDCSHLSFGSFGSNISATYSGPFASRHMKSNVEEESADADASSIEHSEIRNSKYYGDERPLVTASDGNVIHRTGATVRNYDSPSASQQEVSKQENVDATSGNQYTFPSSTPDYTFENSQQLNTAFPNSQTSSQMQNLVPFSSSVTAYTNSLPSTLLAATVQPARESDIPYSPFPAAQSMPTKHGNSLPSITGSTISIPEALRMANFSSTQPTPQTLPGTSITSGPALPQHVAMHPYSQPTLPLGPFTNIIGYPFLPQSYTYMPSAFQQAFAGNSTYHQSLAAVLPQYKNSVSVSSLPQSASIASGYGGFGSSANVSGNFPMNPPAGTATSHDDVLSSQYKDNNHLMSLQQNENSAMWIHGPGSRTMSAVPASTFYGFQGQNQQLAGLRQGQQPSQNYGAIGYPNFYHSQTGISLEQQQNPRESSIGGSQGQPSKQPQQLWQNSY